MSPEEEKLLVKKASFELRKARDAIYLRILLLFGLASLCIAVFIIIMESLLLTPQAIGLFCIGIVILTADLFWQAMQDREGRLIDQEIEDLHDEFSDTRVGRMN
jgi:hypothetical protein